MYPARVVKANQEWHDREVSHHNVLIAAYERDIDTTHELQSGVEHLVRNSDGSRKEDVDTQTAMLWNMYSTRYDMLTKKVNELKHLRDHIGPAQVTTS